MRVLSLAVAAALALLPAAAFASSVVVSPSNPDGWAFSNQDNAPNTNASGGFVSGPGTPPLGSGSAQFIVNDSSSSEILYNLSLDNGMTVLVPQFIKEGDRVRIEVETGKYLDRVTEHETKGAKFTTAAPPQRAEPPSAPAQPPKPDKS